MPALQPTITTHPASAKIEINTGILPELSVAASTTDGGTLSYQWYYATTSTGEGEKVGTDSDHYQVTADKVDVSTANDNHFFYVVVTNTKGETKETRTSNRANIRVYDPALAPKTIEFVTQANAVGSVGTVTWDDTEKTITVDNGTTFGASNSFNPIISFSIPANIDMTAYVRLEFDLDTYVNGVIVAKGTQYNNNIAYIINKGDGAELVKEYNAGTGGNYVWTLAANVKSADYTGGQGAVIVTAGNKANQVDKVVIRSVKLVVAE